MRIYYEATEKVEEEPDSIRIDVTDLTDAERVAVKAAIEDVMTGKDYLFQVHNCGHDERKACSWGTL